MDRIRVLLVDDHPVVRTGIRALLQSAPGIVVIAEAKSAAEGLALVEQLQPDVLLLDMEMPEMSGVEVAKQLQAATSPVKVLALSAYDDIQYVRSLLANGAAGYLTKEEAPEMIIEAVRGVARGETGWLSRRVAAKMTTWIRQDQMKEGALSNREMEVLQHIVAGSTNQEVAHALKISEKTVEKHVSDILNKMGVSSRVEAAVQAVQQGLVQ